MFIQDVHCVYTFCVRRLMLMFPKSFAHPLRCVVWLCVRQFYQVPSWSWCCHVCVDWIWLFFFFVQITVCRSACFWQTSEEREGKKDEEREKGRQGGSADYRRSYWLICNMLYYKIIRFMCLLKQREAMAPLVIALAPLVFSQCPGRPFWEVANSDANFGEHIVTRFDVQVGQARFHCAKGRYAWVHPIGPTPSCPSECQYDTIGMVLLFKQLLTSWSVIVWDC